MLDDVLAEIVERSGGVNALAAELRVTSQAVFKWRQFGIPESRVLELEKISGIPRDKIRRYSQRKQNGRRRGLEWWEPTPTRAPRAQWEQEPDPHAAQREEMERNLWRYDRRYLLPAADLTLPFRPAPPVAFGMFSILNAAGHLPRNKHLLMMFARTLYAGKSYHLRPQGMTATKAIGLGCWLDPRTIVDFRTVARCLGATETSIDGALIFDAGYRDRVDQNIGNPGVGGPGRGQ
jgi:hypothetical protein